MPRNYKYHGAHCDFDFYIVRRAEYSIKKYLSLEEAFQEMQRLLASSSKDAIALGIAYRITDQKLFTRTNLGACDLLYWEEGKYLILDDIKRDEVLMAEGLISINSMEKIKAFVRGEEV